jgi:hypothetical protein
MERMSNRHFLRYRQGSVHTHLLFPVLEPPSELNAGGDERWESVSYPFSAVGEIPSSGL